jgi:signal peptidase I
MLRSRPLAICLLAMSAAAALYASERLTPFVVVSGSMAEMLRGPHRQLACPDCGHRFVCDADLPVMREKRALCPNCGASGSPLDLAPAHCGQRLLVDTHAFRCRPPRRWELAVFCPKGGTRPCVKRIVGLPGEPIEIREGDIYANGVIQRKQLDQQRAMAVLVYDDRHRPAGLPMRWRTDHSASGWRMVGSGYRYTPEAERREQDWLVYHHARRRPGDATAVDEVPITDGHGYNQGGPILTSHAVTDIMLSAGLSADAASAIDWSITDGRSHFIVSHDVGRRQVVAWQDGRRLATGKVSSPALPTNIKADTRVELSLCDEQLTFALDGVAVIEAAYVPRDVERRPTASPLAVKVSGGAAAISALRVWRDVYYAGHTLRRAAGSTSRPARSLAADEYYALGDNVLVSQDSRCWPAAAVRHCHLVGKPLP